MSDEETFSEFEEVDEYINTLIEGTGITQVTKRKRKRTKTDEEKKAKRKEYNLTMRNKLKSNNAINKATALDSLQTLIEWCDNDRREDLTFEEMKDLPSDRYHTIQLKFVNYLMRSPY
jgi:hypothetical protein